MIALSRESHSASAVYTSLCRDHADGPAVAVVCTSSSGGASSIGTGSTGVWIDQDTRGPIYQISYDLAYDYRKFIVRSTCDSDLKRAKISLRNIVS